MSNNLDALRKELYQLQPWCHYAADLWLQDCFDNGHKFTVREVHRPQERQYKLVAQGRTQEDILDLVRQGRITRKDSEESMKYVTKEHSEKDIVTWTARSKHTERLAADISPHDGDFDSIAEIGEKYGISNPLPLDRWHFEFTDAITRPVRFSIAARIKRVNRAITRATRRGLDNVLRMKRNLQKRMNKRIVNNNVNK